jgi:hypothetical protein
MTTDTYTDPAERKRIREARYAARRRAETEARQAQHRADFIADVELLTGTDTVENIAARLGVKPDTAANRLRDWGRPDLARPFDAHVNKQKRRRAA